MPSHQTVSKHIRRRQVSVHFIFIFCFEWRWSRVILKSCGNNGLFYIRWLSRSRLFNYTYLRFQLINFASQVYKRRGSWREKITSAKVSRTSQIENRRKHREHGNFFDTQDRLLADKQQNKEQIIDWFRCFAGQPSHFARVSFSCALNIVVSSWVLKRRMWYTDTISWQIDGFIKRKIGDTKHKVSPSRNNMNNNKIPFFLSQTETK